MSHQQPCTVQTVLGRISADDLGITLPHEHLLINLANVYPLPAEATERRVGCQPVSLENRGWVELHWGNRDNLVLDDEELAIAEAERYYRAGGHTIVDVTPVGIGRDPLALARIARATKLNIVMGSGYYVEVSHPSSVARLTEDAIADEIIHEFKFGVADTGIRPGVIGEVGCSWPLTSTEQKVLRGAGAAQRELQCALSIHPGRHPKAPMQIIQVLRESGADLRRVIMSHMERTVPDVRDVIELAEVGCFVEFDLFGVESTAYGYREAGIDIPSDAERLKRIQALFESGHGDRILISQDICYKHRLVRYGGQGYEHILRNIVPWMKQRGFDEAQVTTILVSNPRNAFGMTATGGDDKAAA